jgi:hypothetical protein
MLRWFVSIVVLAALAGGCGSEESEPAAATATPTPTPERVAAETHSFDKGHSAVVRRYYGDVHEHATEGDVEAEYHQPPRPATGGVGDTITLTGSNIGVRMRVTLKGVKDPAKASRPPAPGTRWVAVELHMRNTGIAVLEGEVRNALLHYDGGEAEPVLGVKAGCSNDFDTSIRIGDERPESGCILFELPESAEPGELQFALETVPAEAGGRWRLR